MSEHRDWYYSREPLIRPRKVRFQAGIDLREVTREGDKCRQYEPAGKWAEVIIPIPMWLARLYARSFF